MVDWKLLGIDSTTDLKKIKQAYAKQLKIYHPEDNPEGYQRLREVFDQAKKYVKMMQRKEEDYNITNNLSDDFYTEALEEESDEGAALEVDFDYENTSFAWEAEPINTVQQNVNSFLVKVEELYKDFSSRIEISNWEQVLDSDIVWDISAHDKLIFRMTDFLTEHCQLPKEIWILLERYFNWKENNPSFYETYIINSPDLPYQSLVRENIDRDSFLFYRDQLFICLKENQLDDAIIAMENAIEIFPNDLDLQRLQAEYYVRIKDYEKAIEILSLYLQNNPDNLDIRLKKVSLLLELNRIEVALRMCEQMDKEESDNTQVLRLLGTCLYKQGEMEKARDTFKRLLQKEPFDPVAHTYLPKVSAFHNKKGLSVKAKREMKQEKGFIGIKEKSQMFWKGLPKITFVILIFAIIILHINVNQSFLVNTGVGALNFIKHELLPPKIRSVSTIDDFPKLNDPNYMVSTTIYDAFFTGYYKTQLDGSEGYYYILDLIQTDLIDEDNGKLIWLGYLADGTPVTFLIPLWKSDWKKVKVVDMEIVGMWESNPYNNFGERLKDNGLISQVVPGNLITDQIIDGTKIPRPEATIFNLPILLYGYVILLGILYFYFIRLLIRVLYPLRY